MAKKIEKKQAKIYFVEQGKSQKEISRLLGVSEPTISSWVNDGGWKTLRTAHVSNTETQTENINQLINSLAEQRIKLMKELEEAINSGMKESKILAIRKAIAQTDDGVSKWGKTLQNIDKDSKPSLSTYISIMTEIFEALNNHDPKLYLETLDFQETHINKIATRYN